EGVAFCFDHNGHTRKAFDFGLTDGQRFDVECAAGEESCDTGENTRDVLDQYRKGVALHVSPPRPNPGSCPGLLEFHRLKHRMEPSATPWSLQRPRSRRRRDDH